MKLGLSSYTYPWACGVPGHEPDRPLSAIDLCGRALRLGLKVVQLCENVPLHRNQISTIKDLGLEVEIGTRGLMGEYLAEAAGLALELGSPFVRLVIDRDGHEPSPDQTIQLLRGHLKTLPSQLQIALENHDRFSANTLAGIIEAAGPERVGVTLDTVNSFGALEGPEATVRTLAPYVISLHLKDFTIDRIPSQMGFVISGCPAGEGRLDIPWLLDSLSAAGRNPNAILELWTPARATLAETIACEEAWAEKSIDTLRRFIPNQPVFPTP